MQPFRLSMLAILAAAFLALPVTSADAHRRHYHHHHGNAAGAVALGIISGALIGGALSSRHHYRAPRGYCYDPYGRVHHCGYATYDGGTPYRMVPRSHHYQDDYVYRGHHDRVFEGHRYYNQLRNERR